MLRKSIVFLGLVAATPAAAQMLDPETPIGIEAGRFVLFPAVENQLSNSGSGWTATVSPELLIRSNWDRHAAEAFADIEFAADGSFVSSLLALGLNLEIGDVWGVELAASHQIVADNASDPGLPPGVDAVPNVHTTAATAAVTGPIGDYALRLDVGVTRDVHDDAIVGGLPVDQSERDNYVVSANLRLARDTGGMFAPFVEVGGGRRFYDVALGSDGFLQAGNFASVSTGIAYDSTPVLAAEVAFGYHWEIPDDPALSTTGAFTIDADAVWSPHESVAMTFAAGTAFQQNPASPMGSSMSRSVSLETDWAVLETVTLSGGGSWGRESFYDGTIEQSAGLGASLTWTPNPWSELSLAYQRSWLWSPDPLRDGVNNTFTITARVLR